MINRLSQKDIYASMKVDPVINALITNEVKVHLHICDHSILTFGLRGLCLGFSNTSHVESLGRFTKTVVDTFKFKELFFIESL